MESIALRFVSGNVENEVGDPITIREKLRSSMKRREEKRITS